MTDISFPASKPGHVVRHHGKTILFSDGTGEVTVFESDDLADGQPKTETHKAAEAHHGVAVEFANGELVLTLGNDKEHPGSLFSTKTAKRSPAMRTARECTAKPPQPMKPWLSATRPAS